MTQAGPDSPETSGQTLKLDTCGILQDMKKKREQVRWKIGRSFFFHTLLV